MWETWVWSPALGRSPGEGKGYPLQYSGLENSMDYTVSKSQTWQSDFHFSELLAYLNKKKFINLCYLQSCFIGHLLTADSNKMIIYYLLNLSRASLVAQTIKNLPAMQETQVQTPGLGRSPGEGNVNPLQHYYLENSMDGRVWWATVHGSQSVRHDWGTNTFTFVPGKMLDQLF